MKRYRLILAACMMLASVQVNAQELETLTYEQCNTASFFEEIKNGTTVGQYVSANGTILSIGDSLIMGTPSGSKSSSRAVGGGGGGAHVGAGISGSKTNTKAQFSTIIMGKPAGLGNVIGAASGDISNNAPGEMQGQAVVIADMWVRHDGSKKKPLYLVVLLGEPNGRAFGINKYMSTSNYEASVTAGEIKTLNTPMTRDEAIAALKEAKDLLDLEMMTEEEYKLIKEELSPIIMKSN